MPGYFFMCAPECVCVCVCVYETERLPSVCVCVCVCVPATHHQGPESTFASSGARLTISLCTVMDDAQLLWPPDLAALRQSSAADT